MVYLSKMVIFHGYVKLPEGNGWCHGFYGDLVGLSGNWWDFYELLMVIAGSYQILILAMAIQASSMVI